MKYRHEQHHRIECGGFSVYSILAGCMKTVQVMDLNVTKVVQKSRGKEKEKGRQNERRGT